MGMDQYGHVPSISMGTKWPSFRRKLTHTHTHTHSIFQLRSTRIPGLPWHSFGVVDGLGVIDLQEISSAPPDHKKAICPNPPIENGVPLKSPIIDLCLHHFHIGVSSYSLSFDGHIERQKHPEKMAEEQCGRAGIQLWSSSSSRGAWNVTKHPAGICALISL